MIDNFKKINFNIITLFPNAFPGSLDIGLIGKSMKNGFFSINPIDLKKYAKDGRVDDRPFGGGPGMVIQPDILSQCFYDNNIDQEIIFFLSPGGITFNQNIASFMLDNFNNINILCGRYEGIDYRLFQKFQIIEISIGDFILCGGEIAAMVIVETIARLIPGVLHNKESIEDESFSKFLLEHNHYTHPRHWGDIEVPEVLFSGHHQKIEQWRLAISIEKTKNRRPDLWIKYMIYCISILIINLIYRKFFKENQ